MFSLLGVKIAVTDQEAEQEANAGSLGMYLADFAECLLFDNFNFTLEFLLLPL